MENSSTVGQHESEDGDELLDTNTTDADHIVLDFSRMPAGVQLLWTIVWSLLSLALVANNGLVVCVALLDRRHGNSRHLIYVMSRAASDLVMGVLVIPATAIFHTASWSGWSQGVWLPYLLVTCWVLAQSTGGLLLLALDRYERARYGMMHAEKVTTLSCLVKIGVMWALCALYYTVPLVLAALLNFNGREAPVATFSWLRVMFICWVVVHYVVTGGGLVGLCCGMYSHLKTRQRSLDSDCVSNTADENLGFDKEACKSFAVLSVTSLAAFTVLFGVTLTDLAHPTTVNTLDTVNPDHYVLSLTVYTFVSLVGFVWYSYVVDTRIKLHATRVYCPWKWSRITPMLQVAPPGAPSVVDQEEDVPGQMGQVGGGPSTAPRGRPRLGSVATALDRRRALSKTFSGLGVYKKP